MGRRATRDVERASFWTDRGPEVMACIRLASPKKKKREEVSEELPRSSLRGPIPLSMPAAGRRLGGSRHRDEASGHDKESRSRDGLRTSQVSTCGTESKEVESMNVQNDWGNSSESSTKSGGRWRGFNGHPTSRCGK